MPFPPPSPGGGINQLTGDVTAGPGTGSQAATLASAGTAGTYGSGQLVPVITTDSKGRVTGVTTAAPDDTTKVPLAGGTMTGQLVVPDLSVSGLTGATAASRYVGATTSGSPASGTFALGDFVIDQTGNVWVCTTGGTPGTWAKVGGAASLTNYSQELTADVSLNGSAYSTIFTQSLGVGTWLVSCGATFQITTTQTSNNACYLQAIVSTGTMTLSGQTFGSQVITVADGIFAKTVPVSFIATVTAAGNLVIEAFCQAAANVIGSSPPYQTGATFVKIA